MSFSRLLAHVLVPVSPPVAEKTRSWQLAFALLLLLPWTMIASRSIADISCGAMGLLFLFHSAKTRRWGWLRDPVMGAALLAWGWLLLISPFAHDVALSFALAGPWLRFILMYAAIRHWILTRPQALYAMGWSLALMLLFVTIDSLWQYTTGMSLTGHLRDESGRLTGPFDQVKVGIYSARMLIPAVGICLYFALKRHARASMAATLSLLLATLLMILLSGERTAFLSTLLVVGLLAGWFCIDRPHYRKPIGFLFLVLLAGFYTLLYTQFWLQYRAVELYDHVVGFAASPYGELFKGGVLMGIDNPLAGVGLRGFRELCPDLIKLGHISYCNLHPHNPYVEWFAETGLPGLVLFSAMVLAMLASALVAMRGARGIDRLPPAFALAGLTANFFPLMATQSIFSNWPAILLWLSASLSLASLNLMSSRAE